MSLHLPVLFYRVTVAANGARNLYSCHLTSPALTTKLSRVVKRATFNGASVAPAYLVVVRRYFEEGENLSDRDFHRDNHFVPRLYLKLWETSPKQVWTYPILVSHEKMPLWKERSTRGIAYHAHLYTRLVAGQESDEIERWLDQEYEAPAEEVIKKLPLMPGLHRMIGRDLFAFWQHKTCERLHVCSKILNGGRRLCQI